MQKFIKTFKIMQKMKEIRKNNSKNIRIMQKSFKKLLDGKMKSLIMHNRSINIKTQTMSLV